MRQHLSSQRQLAKNCLYHLHRCPNTRWFTVVNEIKAKGQVDKKNSGAMQKVWINKLAKWDLSKHAVKKAMKWYAQAKNILSGLSSYQVAAKVKKEYDGIEPHPVTICC